MLQDLNIIVVNSFDKSDEALDILSKATVLGLDSEWDIAQHKGPQRKPDLLQIATPEGCCALFRLNLLKVVPRGLQRLLENPFSVKVGVGITEDTQMLKENFGVDIRSTVDLRHVADDMGYDPRGLSHLSECVLGIPCKKYSWASQFHQWSGYLSGKQLRYAAADAVLAVRIFNKLRLKWAYQKWGDQYINWSDNTYHQNTKNFWKTYLGKNFNYNSSKFFTKEIVDNVLSMSSTSTHPT